jgi:hypothetical protein
MEKIFNIKSRREGWLFWACVILFLGLLTRESIVAQITNSAATGAQPAGTSAAAAGPTYLGDIQPILFPVS